MDDFAPTGPGIEHAIAREDALARGDMAAAKLHDAAERAALEADEASGVAADDDSIDYGDGDPDSPVEGDELDDGDPDGDDRA